MSLLKKLFGGHSANTANPNAPREYSKVQRHPRVQLLALHQVTFLFDEASGLQRASVSNLSMGGMALLWPDPEQSLPTLQSTFSGSLEIVRQTFPLKGKFVHTSDRIVGCQFTEVPSSYASDLARYFNTELAATRLHPINPEMLEAQPDGNPHFFAGPNQCELFYVENQGRLIRFSLTFLGNHLEGLENGDVKAGWIKEDTGRDEKPTYKGSSLVHSVGQLPPETFNSVLRFIHNIPCLNPEIGDEIIQRIQTAYKINIASP